MAAQATITALRAACETAAWSFSDEQAAEGLLWLFFLFYF